MVSYFAGDILSGIALQRTPASYLGRDVLGVDDGQGTNAGSRVHPLQAPVLSRHHCDRHLAGVVLVDDAVLRALHHAHTF